MVDLDELSFVTIDPKTQGAFRTHLRYLEAFAKLATDSQYKTYDAYQSVANRFRMSPHMPTIPFKMRDVDQVKKSLQSAWGTELLLYLGHKFLRTDEIIRLSNTWNVVQAYYAVYHSTQALAAAKGFSRPETHPKTQRVFLDIWCKLPDCFIPWCFSYDST